MTLTAGARLGPYEILSSLGAGGMGEVYKSRDTRLDRFVAIKVLPSHLADQPELRERFEREARVVSSLSHPHICTLHDVGRQDGIDFIVMEYIEGETLAARLARGALPLDQALKVAAEIADALDKAHRQGIVHRDLKPGNVMLGRSGSKLLDFGLARLKQTGTPPIAAAASALPTQPEGLTVHGAILGTLQYMAPEQIEGREADARTDIFAFGVVVYEMVTGRKAFEGKSQLSVVGAILEREPAPMTSLQPTTPPALERVVRRCLAKDPDERWQAAADLANEITWLGAGGAVAAPVGADPRPQAPSLPRRARTPWMLATVFIVTTVVLGVMLAWGYGSSDEPRLVSFTISPPANATFESALTGGIASTAGNISPDGRTLAFTAREAKGQVLIWIRPLATLTAQPLAGTEGAALPFWSPDSRAIGFFAQGKLKKVDVAGGPPQAIADAPLGRGGSWNREGVIIFAPAGTGAGLFRVNAAGGDPVALTKLLPGQFTHLAPAFLPDGRRFLYQAQGVTTEASGVFAGSLDSPDVTRVVAADGAARYAAPGFLLFVRQTTLLAQAFDARTLRLDGDPIRIAESIQPDPGFGGFSVSDGGVLAYRTGPASERMQLGWYDRSGRLLESVGAPGRYVGVDVSSDGNRVAVHRHDPNGGDVWIFEPRGTMTRFTFDAAQENSMPVWSPDGSQLVFASVRNGKWGLYQKRSDGTGREERLLESALVKVPMAWAPDSKSIVYLVVDPTSSGDLWQLPLAGDRKPVPLLNSRFNETHAQVSPNGRWFAYRSFESGQGEVYVKPFPSGDGKWQVSAGGGTYPRWRRDGKELFFLSAADGGTVVSVDVNDAGSTFGFGTPKELFNSGFYNINQGHVGNYHTYAIAPDGQRFLIPRPGADFVDDAASKPITVVLNWAAMLNRR